LLLFIKEKKGLPFTREREERKKRQRGKKPTLHKGSEEKPPLHKGKGSAKKATLH